MKKILTLLVVFISCSGDKEESPRKLAEDQKTKIHALSKRFESSLNNSGFKFFQSVWDDKLFEKRIEASNVNRSVYKHFQKEFVNNIRNLNINQILDLNEYQGKASCVKVDFFEHHAELSYLFLKTKPKSLTYYKYRVEPKGENVFISDVYDFRSDSWYSEAIIKTMDINAKYKAGSEERRDANVAIARSKELEAIGDFEGALHYLYEIPETHWIGNYLSLERVGLAVHLDDTTFSSVLIGEYDYNKSLYMRYLYSYYFDSLEFNEVTNLLKEQTKSDWIDSLANKSYFWN